MFTHEQIEENNRRMRILVEKLFHEVADLPDRDRARFFAEHDIDEGTRNEVEALVAFDLDGNATLELDIGNMAQDALSRFEPKDIQCGQYRLGELLGRGGMGAVYLAERVDGEVKQRVAVKLLRPGADDPSLRQRFLAERQILAELSHPNIARLLDAGHQQDGQPYLVMEHVEGKAIDVYAAGFGVRQKIKLFLKVCAAVSYLHRNLVVHRDLKPANILVTAEGEPKLLDFGIAKMLDPNADSAATSVLILTPDYASPEQANGIPVTTATDIYSLGAVLYKVLTGESPHQFESRSVGAMALAISTGAIVPPSKLAPVLKGDVEMILMKALRTEPLERYATVEQFSEDLENYLQSRPIRARKGDVWYRARKFLRRYWLPVVTAVIAVAGLAVGVLVANQQRAIAQRRFNDVRQLANKLFDIDAEARNFSGSTKTRQLIVDTSLEYLRRLSADAKRDPELALDVGNAYMRVARVQGVPISQNLGQMEQAEKNLRNAEEFIHAALLQQPTERRAFLREAQIAHDRMLLARFSGQGEDPLRLARESAAWLEKFDARDGDKPEAAAILNTYLNVAHQHMLGGEFNDALRLCERASGLARSFNKNMYVGNFLWVSAEIFQTRGELEEALKTIRESVTILDGAANSDHSTTMNLILALNHQGRILGGVNGISLGRTEEAVPVLERSFSLADKLVHQDRDDQSARGRLAMAGLDLADMLRDTDARRALAIYDHVLLHMGEISNNSSFRRFEVSAFEGSSYALRRLGRSGEARRRLDEAFERLRALKAYPAEKVKPGSESDKALRALADYEASRGDVEGAIQTYEELLGRIRAWGVEPATDLRDAVDISKLYAALALIHKQAGQTGQAVALRVQRRDLWRKWDARLPHNNFVRRQLNAADGAVQ